MTGIIVLFTLIKIKTPTYIQSYSDVALKIVDLAIL